MDFRSCLTNGFHTEPDGFPMCDGRRCASSIAAHMGRLKGAALAIQCLPRGYSTVIALPAHEQFPNGESHPANPQRHVMP